jgi:2,4-dienoyl-CoA reductase (NADPH2)
LKALLTDTFDVAGHQAPSRVIFGPHETNLGDGRRLSPRHVAYYERRARGGAGLIVVETASVTVDDWPYERAPLASVAPDGWRSIAEACRPHGTVVLAGLGHSGGQGSSAYSQQVMWAPSRVADAVSREPPAELDHDGIEALVRAFSRSARFAVEAGLAGVEVDAGPFSLLRQFHSGLTNLRNDRYGQDRLAFTRSVLSALRDAVGAHGVVALRLSCDELAPWAGVTPEAAAGQVAELAPMVDLITVVRGGPFDTGAYRPDGHTPPGFNRHLCADMKRAGAGVPIAAQGSIVDPELAGELLAASVCDMVEMTRALIADAALVAKLRSGRRDEVRPCVLCNQACKVRDSRNPIVSCVIDPVSGYETAPAAASGRPRRRAARVMVVGAGPAGLETAGLLASCGATVRVLDRRDSGGGAMAEAAITPGQRRLATGARWLEERARRSGAALELGVDVTSSHVEAARADGWEVVLATGSRFVSERYPTAGIPVLDPLDVLTGRSTLPDGPVAVLDPVGGWMGVNVAFWLASEAGRAVALITPDVVAGTLLARGGQLGELNFRLERCGVKRVLRSTVSEIGAGFVGVADPWTAARAEVPAAVVVDCGHRLPDDSLYEQLRDPKPLRVGDCVAPRSVLEAVLEARRAAVSLGASEEMSDR